MSLAGKILCIGIIGVVLAFILLPVPIPAPDRLALPPSSTYWLGTTVTGYDTLHLVMYATIASTVDAMVATSLTLILAGLIGFMSGSLPNGWVDRSRAFVGRILDSIGAFILCASLFSIFGKTPFWVYYIVLAIVSWPGLASIIRAGTVRARGLPYIEAVVASGFAPQRILFVHVLPELLFALRPYIFALFSGFVGIQGALGFLGLGNKDQSNLGYLLFDLQSSMTSPGFIAAAVSLMLLLVTGHAASRIGFRRQDAFEPYLF